HGKTSSVSSIPFLVRQITTRLLITAAMTPITSECGIVTKPAPGVMATKPTTAPIQAPIAEGFLPRNISKNTQDMAAAADAVVVVAKAYAAKALAPPADPALKPNHPSQSKPVPSNTSLMRAGTCDCSLRFPRYKADAKAAHPADI